MFLLPPPPPVGASLLSCPWGKTNTADGTVCSSQVAKTLTYKVWLPLHRIAFYSSWSLHTPNPLCCAVPGTQHTHCCHTMNTPFWQAWPTSHFSILDLLTWKKTFREMSLGYSPHMEPGWNQDDLLCVTHMATGAHGEGANRGQRHHCWWARALPLLQPTDRLQHGLGSASCKISARKIFVWKHLVSLVF